MQKLIKAAVLALTVLGLYISGILGNNAPFKDNSISLPVNSEAYEQANKSIVREKSFDAVSEVSQDTVHIAPEITKINTVRDLAPAAFKNDRIAIEYALSTGTADFYWDGRKIISAFYSCVKLPELITSKDYAARSFIENGNEYIVLNESPNLPAMRQIFTLDSSGFFTIRVLIEGSDLSTNWFAPLIVDSEGSVDLGKKKDVMALWVPFDNDRDVKYDASPMNKQDASYEVAAFYDNESRNGLVVGSVTHDTWKTGIDYSGSENKLDSLAAYGGASINSTRHSDMVRDVQQHGFIKGDAISSPTIFVGFFDDWRTGMEKYADANAQVVPKLPWNGGVIFGWNSWGAAGAELDTNKALAAADFINDSLMDKSFMNDNTAYINLDSYWDSPSVDLELFVSNVHQNGQKAGIYWSPFVDWAKDGNRSVEGTKYKYSELWLKDSRGSPITYDNGPFALDPTHPGTLQRIDYYMDFFKQKGFDEYIKLDFLTHAALEGEHYDISVSTGMQAINKGMAYLLSSIRSRMSPDAFISQAISPLFPYQYAHSRRFSCDKFGFIYESRDVANSAAYSWWMSGRLYSYNDPDHLSLYSVWWNKNAKISENEAKTRVTSAVISGTVYLSGDDFTDPAARERALKYLTNTNINHIARMGKPFLPMDGNTGTSGPDVFTLDNGDGTHYIAVFNWDGLKPASKVIDLKRAGLDPEKQYIAIEQWSNTGSRVFTSLKVSLNPGEAKIFLLK